MPYRFELDPAHTIIGFTSKHLAVTTVRGTFQKFSGWFEGDRKNPSSLTGEVTVDVMSLTTGTEQRDNHLRSPDFFGADEHPEAVYRPLSATTIREGVYQVQGELTIRKITKPLVLKVKIAGELDHPYKPGSRIVSLTATGALRRKDFGLNWDGLAGTLPIASNEIKLEIDAELVSVANVEAQTTAQT